MSHTEDITVSLPPSRDIIEKTYSLEPDMIFGWMPKLNIPNIVPVDILNKYID